MLNKVDPAVWSLGQCAFLTLATAAAVALVGPAGKEKAVRQRTVRQ